MKPLVSILIPAYNAEDTIAQTLRSAIAQTWPRKEIILVDDGSTDRTAEVAQRFGSNVTVVSSEHRGAQVARNHAFRLSQGEYIQWLDADDLLAPDKIERQIAALRESDGRRILLSSPWAPFYYRTRHARFVHNSLCEDLSPAEWLLRKMGENLFIQPGGWLTSRELIEAAGRFDTSLSFDDDGEYYCRVLLASAAIRFVPGTGVLYRMSNSSRVSYIGNSEQKKDSLLRSMKVHIQCLRSLEESDRVRKVCLTYLQDWYPVFYLGKADKVEELQRIAARFGGCLEEPELRWKYAWLRPLFGWKAANWAQTVLPQLKASYARQFDKLMYMIEDHGPL
jgi:glycosyltransferase involved in cell wall biosynthesis